MLSVVQSISRNKWFTPIASALVAFFLLVGTLLIGSVGVAAASTKPLAIVYYGWHDSSTDQRILSALPEILIDNTPGGFWHGNCNSRTFQAQGIKVFSYVHASYGSYSLSTNYALIDAIAKEGTYGVFVDEASPSATTYNTQLCAYAHSKGLKVILNPGMPYINENMYSIADYVVTDEHYEGRAPAAVEKAHLKQTIVIGFGNWTAQQAANFTNTAWSKGFGYSWHEQSYSSLPSWLEQYSSLLSVAATSVSTPVIPPTPASPSSSNQISGTVASIPVPTGATNEYALNVKISSSTVSGVSTGQEIRVAASTTDFPNLLTVGSSVNAILDKSLGWWVMEPISTPTKTNSPPVLAGIGAKSVTVGQKLEIALKATDPDGDVVTTSASGLPGGATVSGNLFSWTPSQAGVYIVIFSASDGKATDSESVTITVNPAAISPAPPTATGNTTAVVASVGVSSGAKNEYNLSIRIIATSVSGVTVGQTIWVAATTTNFPSLLTVGSTISGNLDKSLGWWVIKATP